MDAENTSEGAVSLRVSRNQLTVSVFILGVILGVLVSHFALPCPTSSTCLALTGGNSTNIAPVKAVIINDKRCAECDTSVLEQRLQQVLPNIQFTKLDYSSPDGEKLYLDIPTRMLPAVLFPADFASNPSAAQLMPYMQQAGSYLSLGIGAAWDPYCDPDTSHCSIERCASRMNCRVEKPGQLDLFIMSWCPYGTKATDAMKEVLANVQGIDFRVHYIADYDGSKFTSLHGDGEVSEDIRELCAMKQNQRKGLEYIWCRNKDLKAVDWQACATSAGLDVPVMKNCYDTDEGAGLLREDLKIAKALNIGGSPTFIANNKKSYNALTAETIKAGWCTVNQNLDCKKTLSNDAAAASGGGCAT